MDYKGLAIIAGLGVWLWIRTHHDVTVVKRTVAEPSHQAHYASVFDRGLLKNEDPDFYFRQNY